MKLSVIIVNYNVEHFLDQCLFSVQEAIKGLEAEVFVVDNNSKDGSMEMVHKKYPQVICIENKDNRGFSVANNQAIEQSKGEYVLLLNPDTLVEAHTFSRCVNFMDSHKDCGGLGVKMVDGSGSFLPESKRGLPTPSVSFYKIFGLSRMFPKSKKFSKYHLGHLNKNEIHEIEILAGAYMMLRKSVLDQIGLLDETFFMYGEDIDLSYRIIKAGYKNYYYPEAPILHYKGESTKKGSLNYVFVFYNAMIIFAKKHFSKKYAGVFSFFINIAIYFRAALSVIKRFLSYSLFPIIDTLLLSIGVLSIKYFWEIYITHPEGGHFPFHLVYVLLPLYIFTWLSAVYLCGGYDKPIYPQRIFRGMFLGTVIILAVYGLLDESYRFSRAIILLGAVWGVLSIISSRYLIKMINPTKYAMGDTPLLRNRCLIVGNADESRRIAKLVRKSQHNPDFIGLISVGEEIDQPGFIGEIEKLSYFIEVYNANQIIFSNLDVPVETILHHMMVLSNRSINFKTAPANSDCIIGSNTINSVHSSYINTNNHIAKRHNRRNKRVLDIFSSCLFIICSPILMFLMERPVGFLTNAFMVLVGKYSWVGYAPSKESGDDELPKITPAIISSANLRQVKVASNNKTLHTLNLLYAKNYSVYTDVNIIMRCFRQLGNNPAA